VECALALVALVAPDKISQESVPSILTIVSQGIVDF
jgi:hypothetical protein